MNPIRGTYRFGGFVFDPASGELTNAENGAAVTRLQPQVAALLTALLERPGAVVSRAELQARLWPDTTVDFDDGLNFCVRQLRLALGDEAGAPRYVVTLARRGYRFIARVTRMTEDPASVPASTSRSRVPLILVAVILLVAGVFAVNRVSRTSDQPARSGQVLAVVPFMVDTTDSTMVAYQRQLVEQVNAGVRSPRAWDLVADTSSATHVLSGALKRRGFSVEVFVQLVRRSGHRHLWADSILDSYAFSGNSTLTADRIARSVERLLRADTAAAPPPP
jgi:DNA-binding winged helix-turn-helix (wHTH) protein